MKDPEKLQQAIEESGEFIVFKIQPSSNLDSNGAMLSGPKAIKPSTDSKVLTLVVISSIFIMYIDFF